MCSVSIKIPKDIVVIVNKKINSEVKVFNFNKRMWLFMKFLVTNGREYVWPLLCRLYRTFTNLKEMSAEKCYEQMQLILLGIVRFVKCLKSKSASIVKLRHKNTSLLFLYLPGRIWGTLRCKRIVKFHQDVMLTVVIRHGERDAPERIK